MELWEIKEKCKFRLENWDEYTKFDACNKNERGYSRHAERCRVCKECEQYYVEPVVVTEEEIKNGNNDDFIELIQGAIKELNQLLILEKRGGKFIPRFDQFGEVNYYVGLLESKYINKNTDLFILAIDRKLGGQK